MPQSEKMMPVTLILDLDHHTKLKKASKATRIPMSELMRISVDRLMLEIGDPAQPNIASNIRRW